MRRGTKKIASGLTTRRSDHGQGDRGAITRLGLVTRRADDMMLGLVTRRASLLGLDTRRADTPLRHNTTNPSGGTDNGMAMASIPAGQNIMKPEARRGHTERLGDRKVPRRDRSVRFGFQNHVPNRREHQGALVTMRQSRTEDAGANNKPNDGTMTSLGAPNPSLTCRSQLG